MSKKRRATNTPPPRATLPRGAPSSKTPKPRQAAAAPGAPSWARFAPWIVVLLALPTAFAVTRGAYLWTDVSEIAERAYVFDSAAALWRGIVNGVQGYYYRPTVFFLHSLDFWLFGDSPLAFRATNLLLHVLNALLLHRLVCRLFADEALALASAAIFAVHPVVVTPLSWVSDRTDLVTLTGALGTALAVLSYVREGRARSLVFAGLSLFVGLAAKETCAALVGVLALACLAADGQAWTRLLHAIGVTAAITAVWFAWRDHVGTNPAVVDRGLGLADRLGTAAAIHGGYFFQLLFPTQLTACDATRVPKAGGLYFSLAILALAGCGYLLRHAFRARARWLLALAWVAAFLLPSSGILPLRHIRADRYLYPVLPGLAVAFTWVGRRWLSSPKALWGAAYLYLAICFFVRAPRFASDDSLWRYETSRNADCLEGYSNLARTSFLEGHYAETAQLTSNVLARLKPDLLAFVNLPGVRFFEAKAQVALGQNEPAEETFVDLAEHLTAPNIKAESTYEAALLAFDREDYAAAAERMGRALSLPLRPASRADALLIHAYALAQRGDRAAAAQDFGEYGRIVDRSTETGARAKIAGQIREMLGQR